VQRTDPLALGRAISNLPKLNSVHVIAGLEAAHGGPSYSVPRLCEALWSVGTEAVLLSVAGAEGAIATTQSGYCDRRFAWDYAHIPILRGLRSSSALSAALQSLARTADVIHDHGLWLLPNVQAGWAAAQVAKPLIVSPRGMLSPAALAFSRIKKKVFWRFLQGPAARQAACLHATSEQEYHEIRALDLPNPVAIIPNGIDLPNSEEMTGKDQPDRVVLSLGRIHPKKGLERLIRAWAEIEAVRSDWRLRIVGPSEGRHDEELRALAMSLRLTRVSIEAPIYGTAKQVAYREAELFVLPTLNENFGLTVSEALAAGTPVISTKGAPWSDLEAQGCGWWIDHGIEPLAIALATSTSLPREALREMGAKGRVWMAKDFSWQSVASAMTETYRWAMGDADAPSAIRFD
jgi:glycosyltransferase involved in cell wall biosynthesis